MNFESLVLEALGDTDIQVWPASDVLLNRIKNHYPNDSYLSRITKGWKVKFASPSSYHKTKGTRIFIPPPGDDPHSLYITFTLNGRHVGYKDPDDDIIKAINRFESLINQGFSPDQASSTTSTISKI